MIEREIPEESYESPNTHLRQDRLWNATRGYDCGHYVDNPKVSEGAIEFRKRWIRKLTTD